MCGAWWGGEWLSPCLQATCVCINPEFNLNFVFMACITPKVEWVAPSGWQYLASGGGPKGPARVWARWEISEEDVPCVARGGCVGGHPSVPRVCLSDSHQPGDPQHAADWWGKWDLIVPGISFSFCDCVCFCLMYVLFASSVTCTPNPWPSDTINTWCSWVWYYIFSH